MTNPDKPDYTHGSNGTEPSDSIDYTNGDPLDSENLDYFINTPFEKIKAIIDRLVAIDSDGDGKVAADTADSATTASQVKGNDIDSDGDGKVDAADTADSATTASQVKGNDIDSDGDGKVDAADNADYADNADQLDGNHASAFADADHLHNGRYLKQSEYDPEVDTHSRYSDNEARTAVDGSNVSVGYADNAGDADTIDGNQPSNFVATKVDSGSHDVTSNQYISGVWLKQNGDLVYTGINDGGTTFTTTNVTIGDDTILNYHIDGDAYNPTINWSIWKL